MFGVPRLRIGGKPPEGGTRKPSAVALSPEIVGRFVKHRLLTQSRRLAQTPYNSLSRASAKRDTCSAACGVLSARERERFLQRARTDRARRQFPRS